MEKAAMRGTANDFGYLALAKEIAEAAAQSTDLDDCLRMLRAGLVRLGFSRAGIWLIDLERPGFVQGTWGTDWQGKEVDEHALRLPFGGMAASERIVAGEKVVLRRLARTADPTGPAHQIPPTLEGPPNCAAVALRVDNRLLGIISVDMLPGGAIIPPHSVVLLELLADIAATAIARARLVTALQITNQVLAAEVAERQRAEGLVVRRERRHRLLLESTYDVFAVMTRDGTILDISPSCERVFGYSIDEMVGQNVTMLVHPEDLDRLEMDLRNFLPQTGQPFYRERRYRTKNRGWRTIEVIGVSYLDDPAVNGVIATLRDVTERRELEEQFRQVQRMEAVGRLAGGIAHDFNNLLTVITGYAQLLASGVPNQESEHRAIERIREASEGATLLTSQLLAFGRRQIVTLRETSLNAIVEQSSPTLRRLIGEDVVLETRLIPELGVVKVDPGQIKQILLNLSANARDAMPYGGTLTIATANVESGSSNSRDERTGEKSGGVVLTVSDTGIGMDKDVLVHLFEPFFATKEVGKGTGLGLAAVYGIVNQSGGTIAVSSEPGQGTTFRLAFPRIDRASPKPPTVPRREDFLPGHETILVIEDAEDLRDLVRTVLERSGYRVLSAEDGDGALTLADHYDGVIDLVLTDVVMPGQSGREVAEALLQRRPSLRVLYTSGHTDDVVLRHGVRDAEVAFLPKPFTPSELTRKVRSVLDAACLRDDP